MANRSEIVPFEDIQSSDLVVGTTYLGGSSGTLADEPLDRMLHCGNMGGFRIKGSVRDQRVRLVVLFTTFADPDWPDSVDPASGHFMYYGDNKTPGRSLHETPKHGNELLRRSFDCIHVRPPHREVVPPFFAFAKALPGRSVRFLGLAAPGGDGVTEDRDLVAFWRTKGAERFQNYRALFTILDAKHVSRVWIDALLHGTGDEASAPEAWRSWRDEGIYRPLRLL